MLVMAPGCDPGERVFDSPSSLYDRDIRLNKSPSNSLLSRSRLQVRRLHVPNRIGQDNTGSPCEQRL